MLGLHWFWHSGYSISHAKPCPLLFQFQIFSLSMHHPHTAEYISILQPQRGYLISAITRLAQLLKAWFAQKARKFRNYFLIPPLISRLSFLKLAGPKQWTSVSCTIRLFSITPEFTGRMQSHRLRWSRNVFPSSSSKEGPSYSWAAFKIRRYSDRCPGWPCKQAP